MKSEVEHSLPSPFPMLISAMLPTPIIDLFTIWHSESPKTGVKNLSANKMNKVQVFQEKSKYFNTEKYYICPKIVATDDYICMTGCLLQNAFICLGG